jgi:hypothetical protein
MKKLMKPENEPGSSEKYSSEAGIMTNAFAFRIKDNKAILICYNKKGLFEIVHNHDTGEILLERKICRLKLDENVEGRYRLKYAKQYYPKPKTLGGKIKNFIYNTLDRD